MKFRHIFAIAALVGTAVSAAPAAARPAASTTEKKVPMVVYTEGVRSNDAKEVVLGTLPANLDVQDNEEFRKALAKQGQKIPFGLVIALPNKRGPILKRIGKALAAMNAESAIIGFVRPKRGGGQEMLLLVVEKDREEATIDKVVTLGGANTKADTEAALKDLVDGYRPKEAPPSEEPKEEEPKEGEPKPEEPTSDEERQENVYGYEIFGLGAGFDIGGRFASYNDGRTPNLRDYSIFGTPGFQVRGELYPLAPLGIVVAKDIGVTGEFRMAPVVGSETSDGTEVDTTWMRFGGGLRYRIPIPGPFAHPFVIGIRGGLQREVFELAADEPLGSELPSVGYTFLRAGLDGRFPVGPLAITAFGAYLGAIEAGSIDDRFTDSKLGGIDVGGGLTVPIALGFEAWLQAEYTRWFYAFAPTPTDTFIAGGALDEHVHLTLGLGYVY